MIRCSYCLIPIHEKVKFTIHRDGFLVGPEVPLCDGCGGHALPTESDIWLTIQAHMENGFEIGENGPVAKGSCQEVSKEPPTPEPPTQRSPQTDPSYWREPGVGTAKTRRATDPSKYWK